MRPYNPTPPTAPFRLLWLLGVLALVGGCASATDRIELVNASDTWVNVRVFVADPGPEAGLTLEEATRPSPGPAAFVSEARHQVQPGEALSYELAWNPNFHDQPAPLVHVMVEPVTPSWLPAAKQYWVELLTPPPVTIVTSGNGKDLEFNSGGGTVALIPSGEILAERFDHRVVTAPEATQ